MCEEEKEKPDWLSDLQNNQEPKARENIENTFDLGNTVIASASPRYGRRSVSGTKSVENSPTKSSSNESKLNSARSNSARPLRVRDVLSSKVKKPDSAFTRSLEILRDDFEKLSLHNLPQDGPQPRRRNVSPESFGENCEGFKSTIETYNDNSVMREKRSRFPVNVFREKQINEILKDGQQISKAVKVNKACLDRKQPESTKTLHFWNLGRADGTDNTHQKIRKEFIIPELPQGQHLVFNIKTTWGDKHFLGLNGIEIFNSKGMKPQIKSMSGKLGNNCTKGLKYFENLIDNVYLTQDDMHMWMAPYTPNSDHLIHIEFNKIEELAMLRIWNYNKSRIHRNRGVKDIEIKLDDKFVFVGEIAMASGEILNTLNSFGDTILFTTEDGILELVAQNDEYFNSNTFCTLEDSLSIEEMRPLTGGNGNFSRKLEQRLQEKQLKNPEGNTVDFEKALDRTSRSNIKTMTDEDGSGKNNKEIIQKTRGANNETINKCGHLETSLCLGDEIPSHLDDLQTVIEKMNENRMSESDSIFGKAEFFDETGTLYIPSVSALASDSAYETFSMPTGFNYTIQIHSTWGDLYYVGLNGVQIFDENGEEIKLHSDNVRADPESVNILEGMENDARTPDKLIDGVYETIDGCHMWLAPVLPLTINRIELVFQRPVTLSSIKLWNYSKTPGRGVREFGILVDGLLIYNGELNQAPLMGSKGLPRVPCKTINFTSSDGRKCKEDFVRPQGIETTTGTLRFVDQSKRPLTTMTSQG